MLLKSHCVFCLFLSVFFFIHNTNTAQTKKCAVVLDAKTMLPIPYATVVSNGYGAYADTTGFFCSNENISDTFTVSSIGYKDVKFLFSESFTLDTVLLEPKPVNLSTIETGKFLWLSNSFIDQISMKDEKEIKFADNVVEGVTIIKYFSHPDTSKEFIISCLKVRVSQKTTVYKPRKVRVKIFAADENKKPANDILQSNEILTIEKPVSNYIEFDLKRYQVLSPKNGYFIGLEFLTPKIDESDAGSFAVAGKLSKDFLNGEVFKRYYTNVFRPAILSPTQKINVFFNTRLYEYK